MNRNGMIAVLLLVPVSGLAVAYALGYRVQEERTATVTGIVHAPRERVWELVSDIPQQANWRTGMRYVKHLDPQDGFYCWEELQSDVTVPFCLQEQQPGVRQVVRITHAPKKELDTPFRGNWRWELTPVDANDTRVTITERITRRPPAWRFIVHYVTGENTAVNQYLADLQVEAVRRR